jgi:hypothetical protein
MEHDFSLQRFTIQNLLRPSWNWIKTVVCGWFSTVQGQNGEGIPTSNLVPLDARVNIPSSIWKAISNHLNIGSLPRAQNSTKQLFCTV